MLDMDQKPRAQEFVQMRLRALGKDERFLVRAIPEMRQRDVVATVRGEREMRPAEVAWFARALRADTLQLLQQCLADTAPETYEAVAHRFETAMTEDEVAVLSALRRHARADYLASMTSEQSRRMGEWLESLANQSRCIN
jgi:hypothetical protein